MRRFVRDQIRTELERRGFSADGRSPSGSVSFDDTFLDGIELADLFELMITRRDKITRSLAIDQFGDAARESLAEAEIAIDALRSVIGKLAG